MLQVSKSLLQRQRVYLLNGMKAATFQMQTYQSQAMPSCRPLLFGKLGSMRSFHYFSDDSGDELAYDSDAEGMVRFNIISDADLNIATDYEGNETGLEENFGQSLLEMDWEEISSLHVEDFVEYLFGMELNVETIDAVLAKLPQDPQALIYRI